MNATRLLFVLGCALLLFATACGDDGPLRSSSPGSDGGAGPVGDGGTASERDAGTPPADDGGGGAGHDAGTGPAPEAIIEVASMCPTFDPCGGDPEGTWQYVDACVVESFDVLSDVCPGLTVSDEVGTVQGTVRVLAGLIDRESRVHLSATVSVPPSCAVAGCAAVESLLVEAFDTVDCAPSAAGCACDVSVTEETHESGTYTLAGAILTTDLGRRYEFCSAADELVYRELGEGVSEDGTFELERR